MIGQRFVQGLRSSLQQLRPGQGFAATVGFLPERAICLPVGPTATPGEGGAWFALSEAFRSGGAQPVGLVSVGDARARLPSAIGLMSAADFAWRDGVNHGVI